MRVRCARCARPPVAPVAPIAPRPLRACGRAGVRRSHLAVAVAVGAARKPTHTMRCCGWLMLYARPPAGSIRVIEKGNEDRLLEAKQHVSMARLYVPPHPTPTHGLPDPCAVALGAVARRASRTRAGSVVPALPPTLPLLPIGVAPHQAPPSQPT